MLNPGFSIKFPPKKKKKKKKKKKTGGGGIVTDVRCHQIPYHKTLHFYLLFIICHNLISGIIQNIHKSDLIKNRLFMRCLMLKLHQKS